MPCGAVAQLGEHLVCNQGVVGSIPIRSTVGHASSDELRRLMKLAELLLSVALASCASAPSEQVEGAATQQQRTAVLGDTVRLAIGTSVRFAPSGPAITFERVVSDSRCPPDVTCVWAGSVRARLAIADNEGSVVVLELESNAAPRAAEVGAYRILLLPEVEPAPRSAATYVIRILVTSRS